MKLTISGIEYSVSQDEADIASRKLIAPPDIEVFLKSKSPLKEGEIFEYDGVRYRITCIASDGRIITGSNE